MAGAWRIWWNVRGTRCTGPDDVAQVELVHDREQVLAVVAQTRAGPGAGLQFAGEPLPGARLDRKAEGALEARPYRPDQDDDLRR